ncbi:hypothetical protein DNTS_022641, partial [Danionella cerebrum]
GTVQQQKSAQQLCLRLLVCVFQEVENVFVVLSALLHLGDVRFTALSDTDTAFVSDLQLLDRVSGLLQVSSEDLGSALTSDVQCLKGDVITRRHTVEMSNRHRDLLTKALYGRLFSFLVNNINLYLQGDEEIPGDPALEISILDIFGFEDVQRNGYEQCCGETNAGLKAKPAHVCTASPGSELSVAVSPAGALCINMLNERIRQFTAEVLFQQEQQECLQEGVAIETLCSLGNQTAVLDFFFQKPQGVLCIIDEESQSLRPSEASLYKRLQLQLDASGSDAIFLSTKDGNGNPPPKDQGPSFTVTHYAGKVTYDLTGALDLNKDVIPQNIVFVMKTSENVLINQLFQSKLTQTGSLIPQLQRMKLFGTKGTLLKRSSAALSPATDAKKHVELNKCVLVFITGASASSFTPKIHAESTVSAPPFSEKSLPPGCPMHQEPPKSSPPPECALHESQLLKKKSSLSFLQRLERCGPITVALQLRNAGSLCVRRVLMLHLTSFRPGYLLQETEGKIIDSDQTGGRFLLARAKKISRKAKNKTETHAHTNPQLHSPLNSLREVTSKLQACTPHFVECVRPNSCGKADVFDSFHVSSQLQFVGVLEMVRVIRYGYPVRLSFSSFLCSFGVVKTFLIKVGEYRDQDTAVTEEGIEDTADGVMMVHSRLGDPQICMLSDSNVKEADKSLRGNERGAGCSFCQAKVQHDSGLFSFMSYRHPVPNLTRSAPYFSAGEIRTDPNLEFHCGLDPEFQRGSDLGFHGDPDLGFHRGSDMEFHGGPDLEFHGGPDLFILEHIISPEDSQIPMMHSVHPERLADVVPCALYKELLETVLANRKKASAEEKCRQVLQHCKLQGWQMGNSKVFLRYWQADHLNDRCHQLHRKIVVCQKGKVVFTDSFKSSLVVRVSLSFVCVSVVRGWLARHHVHGRITSQKQEQCNVQRFLQGAEDIAMHAYDSLVIQNAADIARENDRLRGHISGPPLGERPEPVGKEEDSPKRTVEKSAKVNDVAGRGGSRPLRHYRSSSVPLPLVMDSLVHSNIGSSIKAVLQPSPHSVDEGNGGSLSSPRKQPPPKPKRDPNTRLSASYEAVSAGLSIAPKESSLEGQSPPSGSPPNTQLSPTDPLAKPRPHSDDYSTMKKIPPPKPKRSPNTKLTGSCEEISAPFPARPTDMKLISLVHSGHCLGLIQRAASADGPHSSVLSLFPGQDEEDVYIEMVGASRVLKCHSPEPAEAVYEEMKYFSSDDVGPAPAVKPESVIPTSPSPPVLLEVKRPITLLEQSGTLGVKKLGKDEAGCDGIPAPFPNLLPHRPPLLVFPPSPVTCSPASDESPLTPLEVKKLPVFETNLNYTSQDGGSPLSPQYSRQRADSSPSLSILMSDKSTPPLTPPPGAPPPYRPPSHFPFPPEPNFMALTRAASLASTESPKVPHKMGHVLGETALGSSKPPFSPVKSSRPEPRRAHSCSSSPLLFNPANGRALTSPLDELNTLFSSGRSLLRKSTTGRKIRDSGPETEFLERRAFLRRRVNVLRMRTRTNRDLSYESASCQAGAKALQQTFFFQLYFGAYKTLAVKSDAHVVMETETADPSAPSIPVAARSKRTCMPESLNPQHTSVSQLSASLRSSILTIPGLSNSNINLPGREDQGPVSSSAQLQDKNANNHTSPNSSNPAPIENGNQVSNGSLEDEGHPKANGSTLHRHMDSHHTQVKGLPSQTLLWHLSPPLVLISCDPG